MLEAAGHHVEAIRSPFPPDIIEDFFVNWALMAGGAVAGVAMSKFGSVKDLEPWTRALAVELVKQWWRIAPSIVRLRRFARSHGEAFAGYDVLLSPTTGTPAPPLGHLSPTVPFDEKEQRLRQCVPFTPPANALGTPALAMPWGRAESGLPLSVQLHAPMGHERRLLELGFLLEAAVR